MEQFERAWAQAYLLIEAENLDPFTINIMLNMAHGAASRGDSFRAGLIATKAVQLATARNESGSVFEGEALLASLQRSKPVVARAPGVDRASGTVIEAFLQVLEHERAMG